MQTDIIKDFYKNDHVYLHVRIHTQKPLEDIKKVFDLYSAYIISTEVGERQHYHVCLSEPAGRLDTLFGKNDFNVIRHRLKKELELPAGNGALSIKGVRNVEAMKRYVLKDGSYIYKGYTEDEVKMLYLTSYKKYDKKQFAIDVDEIRTQYLENKLSYYDACDSYVELKLMYNFRPRYNDDIGVVQGWYMRKHGRASYVRKLHDGALFGLGVE